MVALATASVVSEAWATATAPVMALEAMEVMALEAMEVMAVATSILLSMEDIHPLDFSKNVFQLLTRYFLNTFKLD